MSLGDELNKLAELRASGTLLEEEFTRAKERLLNAAPPRTDNLAAPVNTFRRNRDDRVFGGVCGGIARAAGMESWAWRQLLVVLFICRRRLAGLPALMDFRSERVMS